ncbi:MAG: PDZ domain-containing protein [Acidobacteriota bacterium]
MKTILLVLVSLAPLPAQVAAVRYELRFPNAAHHEAEIRITFLGVSAPILEVVMSRASPGRYALHEFAKNVYNVRATDGAGRPLTVGRPTPYQWNVSGHSGTVVFEYTLFGDALDGTYNAIDTTHAHLNPPATFAWARGMETRPVVVSLEAPAGSTWEVATQLQRNGQTWTESSRDMLMDSPIEFGPHALREWTALGTHFVMAMHSSASDETISEYARLCEAITLEAAGVFGAFPVYDHGQYTFLFDFLPYAGGDGMEHRNSTVITQNVAPGTRSFADLIDAASHEFLHSWNVERIRPKSLEPFDLERANMSGELWFGEGFTNYYSPLVQARAGILSIDDFSGVLGSTLNTTLASPGREVFNAIEMSRMAPFVDRAGTTDPTNLANTYISYYTQGEALALGIDLSIRARFPGKSLDDWMRAMWRAHPDVNNPYTLDDLEATLAAATGSAEFARDLFDRYVVGRQSMDYAGLLTRAGLLLRKTSIGEVWLGVSRTSVSKQGVSITGVTLRGSPAYLAGLDRGDRLTSVDGKDVRTQKDWDKALKSHKPGDKSLIEVEGRAGSRSVELIWQSPPTVELVTYEKAKLELTPAMREFRAAWLKSRALGPLPKLP